MTWVAAMRPIENKNKEIKCSEFEESKESTYTTTAMIMLFSFIGGSLGDRIGLVQ